VAKSKRAKPQQVERRALTIAEFCEAYHMSPELYFKLKRQGKGPREMALGSKKLITLRSAEQWENELEKDAAAANAAASS
jgi:hypothetical protein